MIEILATVFLLSGTVFAVVAGIGVARLPDVPMRMHASTKAGTLGVALITTAVIFLHLDDLSVVTKAIALILFMLLTAPIAAHMIGRAAYLSKVKLWEETQIDELAEHIEREGKLH